MTLSPNQTQPKKNVHRATPIRRISRGVDDRGDQQVYTYSFLRTRVEQWTSCLHLGLFSTYVHGESKVGHISPCSSVFFFVVLNFATIFIPSTVIFGR